MDFDFRQLEAFCRVVEEGGFSKAGKVLHLAQASVSERIANLEEIVGTRLLDRLGRSVVTTPAGRIFYDRASALLQGRRELGQELEAFLQRWQGALHIGGSTVPGNYILPAYLARFRQRYNQVTVQLTVADSAAIIEGVVDGELELGFTGSRVERPGLEYARMWDDELVLAVAPDHPFVGRELVSTTDLAEQPLIAREQGSGTQQSLASGAGKLDEVLSRCKVAAVLGTTDAVKEGIKSGLGIAFISARAVRTDMEAGLLSAVPVKDLLVTRNFYMVRDQRRSQSPLANLFAGFVTT